MESEKKFLVEREGGREKGKRGKGGGFIYGAGDVWLRGRAKIGSLPLVVENIRGFKVSKSEREIRFL